MAPGAPSQTSATFNHYFSYGPVYTNAPPARAMYVYDRPAEPIRARRRWRPEPELPANRDCWFPPEGHGVPPVPLELATLEHEPAAQPPVVAAVNGSSALARLHGSQRERRAIRSRLVERKDAA